MIRAASLLVASLLVSGCAGEVDTQSGGDASVEACDLSEYGGLKAACDCTTRAYVSGVSDTCREGSSTRYLCNQVCSP